MDEEPAAVRMETDLTQSRFARSIWIRVAIVLTLIALLVFAGGRLARLLPQFAAWVDSLGGWGPAVFIAGYAIATVAFVPGSLLTLAAGAIFGLLRGTLIVFAGATGGSILAFLVARYFARAAVERRLSGNSRFEVIDRAVGTQGLKIAFLLRLSPIFPFNLLNYALGLTGVRLRDYALASFGMLPGIFLYVYYGKLAGDVAAAAAGAAVKKDAGYWGVLLVGLSATAAVTAVLTRIARNALKEYE